MWLEKPLEVVCLLLYWIKQVGNNEQVVTKPNERPEGQKVRALMSPQRHNKPPPEILPQLVTVTVTHNNTVGVS